MKMRNMMVLFAVVLLAGFIACGEDQPQVESDVDIEEVVEVVEPAEPIVTDMPVEVPMTDEEKMAYVMENCICPDCPSWIPEAVEKGEGGYCATGASECIVLEAGCVCPTCPVTAEMGLEWGYYCTRGSAEEMMNEGE